MKESDRSEPDLSDETDELEISDEFQISNEFRIPINLIFPFQSKNMIIKKLPKIAEMAMM